MLSLEFPGFGFDKGVFGCEFFPLPPPENDETKRKVFFPRFPFRVIIYRCLAEAAALTTSSAWRILRPERVRPWRDCFFFFFCVGRGRGEFFFFDFLERTGGRKTTENSELSLAFLLSAVHLPPSLSLFLPLLTSRSPGSEPPAPALFRSAFSTRETSASAVNGDDDDKFPPPAAVAAALAAASSQSARRLRPREDARESAVAACEEREAEAIVADSAKAFPSPKKPRLRSQEKSGARDVSSRRPAPLDLSHSQLLLSLKERKKSRVL